MPGPYFTPGIVSGPVSRIDATAKNEVGILTFDGGRILQYVKYNDNVLPYQWVEMDHTQFTTPYQVKILEASVTQVPLGVAEYGGTTGSYGWITKLGPATAMTATTVFAGGGVRPVGASAGVLGPIFTASGAPTQLQGFGIAVATGLVAGSLVYVTCL